MESQALKELIQQIFSDEKTKSQFFKDPESFLASFNLTDQEKKAVLNIHTELGLVSDDSPQLAAFLKATEDWWVTAPESNTIT